MRRLIALVWGGVAALLGILSVIPSFPAASRRRAALVQLIATENPGLAMASGVYAIWRGVRARAGSAIWLGLLGLGLGVRPLIRRAAVNRAMADAMREGLGIGWQRAIPPEVHRAFGQTHRTDLWGPLRYLLRIKVRTTYDVLFSAPDGQPLRLDIVEPAVSDGPRPAIVVVHGGHWFQGDKSAYAFGLHDRWLAAQGYVVFDVQYRLAARWPAPLADVKCAVRWVKANAARYNVDPERVAIMGRAAGAHLALMAAYTADDPAYPAACFGADSDPTVNERVCAVVVSYAPTDLTLWRTEPGDALAELLGGTPAEQPDAYRAASPVAHVRAGLPPTLLIHGQRDRTVSPAHTELLANRLRAHDVTTVTLRIPWGRHGVDSLIVGLTGPMIQYDVDRFLAWVFHQPR